MAGNKKPRKKRTLRPVSPVGGIAAIFRRHDAAELLQPMSDEQITDPSVAFRMAFAQMLGGHASEQNWCVCGCVCVCSLDIALILCEYGIGEQYLPEINRALEGAFRAKLRAGRTGRWGFDGEAIQAIKTAFEIREEQIKIASKQQLREAIREVHRRDAAGNVFQEAA